MPSPLRRFFKKFGIRSWITIVILAGVAFLLLLASKLWREEWITPLPDVVLEPARPVLKMGNVQTDSAFDFLQQATVEQDKISNTADFKLDKFRAESERLNLEPWSEAAFPVTLDLLNKSRKTLELAGKAVAAGDPQIPSHTSPLDDRPYISRASYITMLLRASAARKVSLGDFDGAYTDLDESVDFAEILSRGGAVLPRLVAASCEMSSFKAMRYIALQNTVPADTALRTIRRLDEVDKATEPFAEMFREECRAVPAFVDLVFKAKSSQSLGLGPVFNAIRYIGPVTGGSRTQVRQDLESTYAHLIEIAEKPYDTRRLKKWDDMFSKPRQQGGYALLALRDPLGYMLMIMTTPYLAGDSVRFYTRLADLRATEAVLAIRQFEQSENHTPASLDELVPKYLSAVPRDPFDGKPLRYVVKPGGPWMVYSVGPNQIDEGGLVAPVRPRRYDDPGDLVYPGTEASDARGAAGVTPVQTGTSVQRIRRLPPVPTARP